MFTSDGASVMLGRHKGAAALLKRQVPHLTEQHCVAHREDLGIDDAWEVLTCFADLPLGKITPCQLKRPVIILMH